MVVTVIVLIIISYTVLCVIYTSLEWSIHSLFQSVQSVCMCASILASHLETDNKALSWLLYHLWKLGKVGCRVVKIWSLKFKIQYIRGMRNIDTSVHSHMLKSSKTLIPIAAITLSLHTLPWPSRTYNCQNNDTTKLNTEPVPKYSKITGVFHCCFPFSCRNKVLVPTAAVPVLYNYHHTSPHQRTFRSI
jgi:hypothetical protein